MSEFFAGKWRATVFARNAGFSQRVRVSGAASGNGTYAGVVGTGFTLENGVVDLEWNNNTGSGWQPSATLSSIGSLSPLVTVRFIRADDNFPGQRDGDYDDLKVQFEHLDPAFDVTQRPYALDRGTLMMFPDGIFDCSQGVQYMGVRIRNTWFFDWDSGPIAVNMKIGIAPASRTALAAAGIAVLDNWSSAEQRALGQVVDGGYVRVPDLKIGEETTVYFKIDVTNASPSKPEIGFVAQRDAFDPRFDAPTRVVRRRVFISRSSYDKTNRELVIRVPEGTLRLKLREIVLDRKAANAAAKTLRNCLSRRPSGPDGRGGGGRTGSPGDWWEDCASLERFCKEYGADQLRDLLRQLLEGKRVDICRLAALLDRCCGKDDCGCGCDDGHDDGGGHTGDPGGGWGDGTGVDGWCRVKPVAWLPLHLEYRIEPNPAYAGQHGPLAFEDPWWKVVLALLAVLLAIASIIYDYVMAGQDPQFIIGKVLRLGDANANLVDCAVSDLNGSRGVDLGLLDAQSDDANNGSPIEGLGTIIQLDRTPNGDNGIQDAVLGNVVWKAGGRSGTTRGMVTSVSFSTNVPYDEHDTITGTISYTNQVHVTQIASLPQPLSQAGDSGSVWVDMASKRPVALNFAGDASDDGTDGIGNPIRRVADQLGIRFNS